MLGGSGRVAAADNLVGGQAVRARLNRVIEGTPAAEVDVDLRRAVHVDVDSARIAYAHVVPSRVRRGVEAVVVRTSLTATGVDASREFVHTVVGAERIAKSAEVVLTRAGIDVEHQGVEDVAGEFALQRHASLSGSLLIHGGKRSGVLSHEGVDVGLEVFVLVILASVDEEHAVVLVNDDFEALVLGQVGDEEHTLVEAGDVGNVEGIETSGQHAGFKVTTAIFASEGNRGDIVDGLAVVVGLTHAVDALVARNNIQVNSIVETTEVDMELIFVTSLEGEVVVTATDGAIGRGNPNTVARSRVGDAPVIGTGRDGDGHAGVVHHVLRRAIAVGIGRDLVAELVVDGFVARARSAQSTSLRNDSAIEAVGIVKQHLVARAVAPNVVSSQRDSDVVARSRARTRSRA